MDQVATWSKEKVLQLCTAFQSEECLWNTNSKGYKNSLKRKDAIHKIASEINVIPADVEKKIKCLMIQYRREKKKIGEMVKSGAVADSTTNNCKWFAFSALQFLGDNYKPNNTLESENTQDNVEIDYSVEQETISTPPNLKRISSLQDDEMQKAIQVIESVLHSKESRNQRDEYTSFGEIVATKIRKLETEYEKNVVQFKINELLFQAYLGYFKPPEITKKSPLNVKIETQDSSSSGQLVFSDNVQCTEMYNTFNDN